jgi:hypothetical protein
LLEDYIGAVLFLNHFLSLSLVAAKDTLIVVGFCFANGRRFFLTVNVIHIDLKCSVFFRRFLVAQSLSLILILILILSLSLRLGSNSALILPRECRWFPIVFDLQDIYLFLKAYLLLHAVKVVLVAEALKVSIDYQRTNFAHLRLFRLRLPMFRPLLVAFIPFLYPLVHLPFVLIFKLFHVDPGAWLADPVALNVFLEFLLSLHLRLLLHLELFLQPGFFLFDYVR